MRPRCGCCISLTSRRRISSSFRITGLRQTTSKPPLPPLPPRTAAISLASLSMVAARTALVTPPPRPFLGRRFPPPRLDSSVAADRGRRCWEFRGPKVSQLDCLLILDWQKCQKINAVHIHRVIQCRERVRAAVKWCSSSCWGLMR